MSEYQRHRCNFQNDGIRIKKPRSHFHENFSRQLVISRETIKDDLENHHCLENIGQEIWTTVIEINNCPFCGEKLREKKIKYCEFSLFDSTGISVDIL
jgi:predicted aldo/keto reductase-like oxidoreductase